MSTVKSFLRNFKVVHPASPHFPQKSILFNPIQPGGGGGSFLPAGFLISYNFLFVYGMNLKFCDFS